MNKELIGIVAGVMVFATIIPYSWRVYRGKIRPNLTSWFLWTVISFALLATYWGSGAKENVWMAVVGCTNPLLVTAIVAAKYRSKIRLSKLDWICLTIGTIALVMWFMFQGQKSLVQYALYVALIADGCAAVPTAVCYWRNPSLDRPFAWGVFGLASALNILAISEHTVANYVYPIYMTTGSVIITIPLVWHCLRQRVPLKGWV